MTARRVVIVGIAIGLPVAVAVGVVVFLLGGTGADAPIGVRSASSAPADTVPFGPTTALPPSGLTHQELLAEVGNPAHGVTVRGRIVDGAGRPVPGAIVTYDPCDGAASNVFTRLVLRHRRGADGATETDGDGRWELANVTRGTNRINVEHATLSPVSAPKVICSHTGPVAVADIEMRPGGIIHGIVRDRTGGRDGAASVTVSGAKPNEHFFCETFTTDHRGQFRTRGLRPGSYRLVVSRREGRMKVKELMAKSRKPTVVTVAAGQVVELDL